MRDGSLQSIPQSASQPRLPRIMEATVDPQPRGPDWMPITPKTGSLFHADSHLEHRNSQKTTGAAALHQPDERWTAFNIGRVSPEVGDVNHFSGESHPPERKLGAQVVDRLAAALRYMPCRSMRRNRPEAFALAKPHDAKLRLAEARGVLEHRPEHRHELAGRVRDDLQYLRRCGLLFQRLRELT